MLASHIPLSLTEIKIFYRDDAKKYLLYAYKELNKYVNEKEHGALIKFFKELEVKNKEQNNIVYLGKNIPLSLTVSVFITFFVLTSFTIIQQIILSIVPIIYIHSSNIFISNFVY